ncbi:unnamed protein product [Chrysoparadoxa australica]
MLLTGVQSRTLLHLDPSWLTRLLQPIGDHELKGSNSWERLSDPEFKPLGGKSLDCDMLSKSISELCSAGVLHQALLNLLWSPGILNTYAEEHLEVEFGQLETLVDTLKESGTLLPLEDGDFENMRYLVPFRLPDFVTEEDLPDDIRRMDMGLSGGFTWSGSLPISFVPAGFTALFTSYCLSSEAFSKDTEERPGFICWQSGVCLIFNAADGASPAYGLVFSQPDAHVSTIELRVLCKDEAKAKALEVRLDELLKTLLQKCFPVLSRERRTIQQVVSGTRENFWDSVDPSLETLGKRYDEEKHQDLLKKMSSRMALCMAESGQQPGLLAIAQKGGVLANGKKGDEQPFLRLLQRRTWQDYKGLGPGGLLNAEVRVLLFDPCTLQCINDEQAYVDEAFVRKYMLRSSMSYMALLVMAPLCFQVGIPLAFDSRALDALSLRGGEFIQTLDLTCEPLEERERGNQCYPLFGSVKQVAAGLQDVLHLEEGPSVRLHVDNFIGSLLPIPEVFSSGTVVYRDMFGEAGGMLRDHRFGASLRVPKDAVQQPTEFTMRIGPGRKVKGDAIRKLKRKFWGRPWRCVQDPVLHVEALCMGMEVACRFREGLEIVMPQLPVLDLWSLAPALYTTQGGEGDGSWRRVQTKELKAVNTSDGGQSIRVCGLRSLCFFAWVTAPWPRFFDLVLVGEKVVTQDKPVPKYALILVETREERVPTASVEAEVQEGDEEIGMEIPQPSLREQVRAWIELVRARIVRQGQSFHDVRADTVKELRSLVDLETDYCIAEYAIPFWRWHARNLSVILNADEVFSFGPSYVIHETAEFPCDHPARDILNSIRNSELRLWTIKPSFKGGFREGLVPGTNREVRIHVHVKAGQFARGACYAFLLAVLSGWIKMAIGKVTTVTDKDGELKELRQESGTLWGVEINLWWWAPVLIAIVCSIALVFSFVQKFDHLLQLHKDIGQDVSVMLQLKYAESDQTTLCLWRPNGGEGNMRRRSVPALPPEV